MIQIVEVDAGTVNKGVDYATKKLLTEVQKTGSYRALKSKLAKEGAASFLYGYEPGLIRWLNDPSQFVLQLTYEIYLFLLSKKVDALFTVTSFDATKDMCTVLVYDDRHPYGKMNSRRIRQFSKKSLLPTELR